MYAQRIAVSLVRHVKNATSFPSLAAAWKRYSLSFKSCPRTNGVLLVMGVGKFFNELGYDPVSSELELADEDLAGPSTYSKHGFWS